uniref:UBX domain-containing protein n=1 Tax=Timema monikensis TaxID=170555 RepID=A0A7R9EAD6_9NEOP|nr:unnamed protein product [Timema monikensis]
MAEKIKKFFQKKKADAKFKMAGPGYKLNAAVSQPKVEASSTTKVTPRGPLSDEAKQAAAAALARLGGQKQGTAAFNTSLAAIQAQVCRELEAEKKESSIEEVPKSGVDSRAGDDENVSPFLAVNGVYFKCPLIGPEVLPKDEWHKKIREFLYEQLTEEQGLTAVLIIHTCNKNREKVEQCVETLCKYLENILHNPGEEKYHRIRQSNRVFQERVAPLEGTQDLLQAAGFQAEDDYLVFSEERLQTPDTLQILCDALRSAEPITLELDHNLQVLLPSQAASRRELPPVFYNLTPEEIKREQQIRSEILEKSLMLRTKAMREKEELREMRKYKYALIRVRFPDGILLQGTFSVYEKFEDVTSFLRETLVEEDRSFVLTTPTGHRLGPEEDSQTLVDLRLVPASVLIFSWDPPLVSADKQLYLKPEVIILVQNL